MLFLATFSFAQQFAQESIKLVESLIGQILRQFKQIGHQQRVASVSWQIQQWLGLIFAAFACQLQNSILVQRRLAAQEATVPAEITGARPIA